MSIEIKTLAYLGPAGTFTKEAAVNRQRKLSEISPHKQIDLVEARSIPEVLRMIRSDQVTYGVIPIETTVNDVKGVIEEFATGDFTIVGEDVIKVVFGLYTYGRVSDRRIKTVVSKPEAYPQCSSFLNAPERAHWIKETQPELTESTAAALAYIAKTKDPSIAAIASPKAALDLLNEGRITVDEYRKIVCQAGIGNSNNQFTRFATIVKASETNHQSSSTGLDATTFILNTGSLYACLDALSNINITKIRSFGRDGDRTSFFITVDGHIVGLGVQTALSNISKHSTIQMLGSYPRDKYPDIEFGNDPEIEDVMDDIRKALIEHEFSNHTQTALAFITEHRPGALRRVVRPFYDMDIKINKLESLHSKRKLGEYIHVLTYANPNDVNRTVLMEQIRANCRQVVEVKI